MRSTDSAAGSPFAWTKFTKTADPLKTQIVNEIAQATTTRDIVVIGASAGGVGVLRKLASELEAGLPAAMLIVLHIGAFRSYLADILSKAGRNTASLAKHGDPLRIGHIYVAPPDHHLLVHKGIVQLSRGPKEHHTRPAIDPLFRSAALWGGPRVIGVVLSGCNDDGTAGLQAIKQCGGLAVVQDPSDAEEPVMPASAVTHVHVDRCVPASLIADTLSELVRQPAPAASLVPSQLAHEHAASLGEGEPMKNMSAIGKPSALVCPDCRGGLFEVAGASPPRYRCHTGHAFTLETLQNAQVQTGESALWAAIRALQEKAILLRRVAELHRTAGDLAHAAKVETQAQQITQQIHALRQLFDLG